MNRSDAGKLGYQKTKHCLELHCASEKMAAVALFSLKDLKCGWCGKITPYEKRRSKFCGHRCAALNRNRKAREALLAMRLICNQETVGSIPTSGSKSCIRCQSPVKREESQYCSISCSSLDRAEKSAEAGTAKSRGLRAYLVRKHGRQCFICGLSEWQGKEIPIEIDHIDGNSDNNQTENIRLLCPNCHAQTDTYKNKNKGRGRAYRRKLAG